LPRRTGPCDSGALRGERTRPCRRRRPVTPSISQCHHRGRLRCCHCRRHCRRQCRRNGQCVACGLCGRRLSRPPRRPLPLRPTCI